MGQLSCYFYVAANGHYACVQFHVPEEKIHFYTSLFLGRSNPQEIDKENPWHIGFLELLNETPVSLRDGN